MTKHVVCRIEELPPGSVRIVTINSRSIGVINAGGTYFALRNICPHQGAPLCEGAVGGTMLPSDPYHYIYGRDDRVVRCPWHGWEFDLETGRSVFLPDRYRVATYPVVTEDGLVLLEV